MSSFLESQTCSFGQQPRKYIKETGNVIFARNHLDKQVLIKGFAWQAGDYNNLRNYATAILKITQWKWKKY